MKHFKTILLAAAAGALFTTACTNQRETPAPQKGEVLLQVASGVNGLRAYDKNWEANDEIGIFASTLSARNVKYTTADAGASVKFTTTERVVVPAGATSHEVKSYYPYKESVTTEVEVALPAAKPLLYATGSVTYDNPTVALVFNHKLAEVKVVISDLEDQKG